MAGYKELLGDAIWTALRGDKRLILLIMTVLMCLVLTREEGVEMQPHERREGEKKLWVSRAVSSSVNGTIIWKTTLWVCQITLVRSWWDRSESSPWMLRCCVLITRISCWCQWFQLQGGRASAAEEWRFDSLPLARLLLELTLAVKPTCWHKLMTWSTSFLSHPSRRKIVTGYWLWLV